MRRVFCAIFLISLCNTFGGSQTLMRRPEGAPQPPSFSSVPSAAATNFLPLTVPAGTPLKVALDQEVRIQKVGQPVHGKITEPVYVFDKLVVPAGSGVVGKVVGIKGVPKKSRTLAAMNANFSPFREVQIEFNELQLANGGHVPIHTNVSPGSNGVLQFIPANDKNKTGVKSAGKNMASRKLGEARQEIKREWGNVRKQMHEPGKMHRLERYAVAQSPYHPQYLDAGTSFNADLQQPLDFGIETLQPKDLSGIGAPPPSGSIVHALLVTPLSSASNKKGDLVDAVISQPLVVSDQLILPQGSHLKGSVLQVRPARRLERNGQLRIVFHQVVPPGGIEQRAEASLEGVDVAKGEHLSLDSEGGAQVTSPRTRYLSTGISVMLASSSVGDRDAGHPGDGGDVGKGAANGASGFRLLGTIVGAFAHSRVVASGFGFYGAAMSVYSHFLARGRDVVYPKDMSMMIGLGTRADRNRVQVPRAPSPARPMDRP